jgi:predicted transposase YbfD/YdcC
MEDQVLPTLEEHFGDLTDPRIDRTKLHKLLDILVIAICAVIAGADNWEDVEEFGKARLAWFRTFLELPNGIPSHDTFTRVFARLDPEQFQACFMGWMKAVAEVIGGQVIAIDGKVLRRSHDKGIGQAAIDMVSAWACANRLVLGQVKVDEKSNEITAIPQLLEVLAVSGCIVTIDAIGCQTEIAEKIIEREAEYVLSLKENQGISMKMSNACLWIWKAASTKLTSSTTRRRSIRIMGALRSASAGRFQTPKSCLTCEALQTGEIWPRFPGSGLSIGSVKRKVAKTAIISPVSQGPNESWRLCVRIGASRTSCIGPWIWPLMRTAAGCAKIMDRKTLPFCGILL